MRIEMVGNQSIHSSCQTKQNIHLHYGIFKKIKLHILCKSEQHWAGVLYPIRPFGALIFIFKIQETSTGVFILTTGASLPP
jgi:hypothetical protein